MISEKVTFSSFHSNHCNGNNFFHHNMEFINLNYPLRKRSQTDKGYSKIILQRCIFCPIAQDLDPNELVKIQKNYFLRFHYDLSYTRVDLIGFKHVLLFLNPVDCQCFVYFVLRTSLKEIH